MRMVCTRCLHEGEPGVVTPGSFALELVLWLCLLVPGLIYSVWRVSARRDCCALCGSTDLVPADSPRGRMLAPPAEAASAGGPPARRRAGPGPGYRIGLALGALFRRR